jgi:2-oxopent-4-enoate/cis-2-oxohex-4-enoate hydratase
MLDDKTITLLADELYQALRKCIAVSPLRARYPAIEMNDAYRISQQIMRLRLTDGETITGKKIGITSVVVQAMFDVHQPDFGFLTNQMAVANGADIKIQDNLIQPRAEGEIAFMLNRDLVGPGITEQHVIDATEYIVPCFEIVDSRIENWQITIEDTIADNASCGLYVLGTGKVNPREVDLPNLKMKVFKNDELLSEGLGSAVQGNPLTAVAWLANTLSQYAIPFNAGEIILSGSLVPLEPVFAGDQMRLELGHVGSAKVNFI